MIELTLEEIAHATGGVLHGPNAVVTGSVVTDSRETEVGSLYVARVGENADGHDFVPAAMSQGAVGVLGSRPLVGIPTVVVDDVDLAFAKLARDVVDRLPLLQIVGITGSSGKTSTKDLLGAVLNEFAPTISPYGSLNSEVGVPLTVCRVDDETRYLVAEMGASGVGHIAYLTEIAPPMVSVVLNVGKAHMGEFGSVEAIARTKGEIVEALDASGVAVLNADDARVAAMASRTRGRVVTVGVSAEADYRAQDVVVDSTGRASYHLVSPQGEAEVQLAVFGEHQVGNSLSVIAAAVALGLPLGPVVEALGRAKASARWRMEVHELPGGVTLVNDAYNANPDSMRAAVRSLAQMGAGRHTVAVLGEMRELGESSVAEHTAIGTTVAREGIDELLVVGAGARPIADGALTAGLSPERVRFADDADDAAQLLRASTVPGHILLFKSSRDSGLRVLGDRLLEESSSSAFPATEVTS